MLTNQTNQELRGHVFNTHSSDEYPAFVWHLTSIRNLATILELGLLSHNTVRQRHLLQQDIFYAWRARASTHFKRVLNAPLHDFVPTFWVQRNPMMYKHRALAQELVWVKIAREQLPQNQCVTATQNAATFGAHFILGQHPDKLRWDVLQAGSWADIPNGRAIRCAELLVHGNIPRNAIVGFQVASKSSWNTVSSLVAKYRKFIPVELNSHAFFYLRVYKHVNSSHNRQHFYYPVSYHS